MQAALKTAVRERCSWLTEHAPIIKLSKLIEVGQAYSGLLSGLLASLMA